MTFATDCSHISRCICICHHCVIVHLQQLDESLCVEIPEGEIAQTSIADEKILLFCLTLIWSRLTGVKCGPGSVFV